MKGKYKTNDNCALSIGMDAPYLSGVDIVYTNTKKNYLELLIDARNYLESEIKKELEK